ncbi:hypothetical protein TNCV_228731 [Trichonephila clavipes]|nr:hypothetical protein TNCV_228731 [Trichonephila clavipes]
MVLFVVTNPVNDLNLICSRKSSCEGVFSFVDRRQRTPGATTSNMILLERVKATCRLPGPILALSAMQLMMFPLVNIFGINQAFTSPDTVYRNHGRFLRFHAARNDELIGIAVTKGGRDERRPSSPGHSRVEAARSRIHVPERRWRKAMWGRRIMIKVTYRPRINLDQQFNRQISTTKDSLRRI